MSYAATSALMESGLEKGGRYAVLMSLAHYLRAQDPGDPKGHRPDEVSVSVITLAEFARLSERQVQRNIKELLADNVISKVAEGGSGPGSASTYRLDCLDLLETVGFACQKARRSIFAGVAKATSAAGVSGAPATLENAAKVIEIVSDAVLSEGHDLLAKKLLIMMAEFHPDADIFLAEKGCHDVTHNKGDICDIRVTSATAKGDIWCKKHLLEDSLESPIARAGAREAWTRILKFLDSKNVLEKAETWLEEIRINRTEDPKRGEVLVIRFPSRLSADRCAEEFKNELRSATSNWSGWLVFDCGGNPIARFGGSGQVSFDDMAQEAITRENDEDAA